MIFFSMYLLQRFELLNPFQPSVAFYTDTSYLFYKAKQLTDYYMKCNTGLRQAKAIQANSLLFLMLSGTSVTK